MVIIKKYQKLFQKMVMWKFLFIKKKNVNKGEAIEFIAKKYGFNDDEIAVFGNDENDLSMFKKYHNSYVVDNVVEHVKNKANNVIKIKDGVTIPNDKRLFVGSSKIANGGTTDGDQTISIGLGACKNEK